MVVISMTMRKILAALLACLGFSSTVISCGMYGSPSATYKTSGVVVSEADDSPIQGIRAVFGWKSRYVTDAYFKEIGNTRTNKTGKFSIEEKTYDLGRNNMFYVELTDVDGEKNGLYASKVVEMDFSKAQFKGGDGNWYEGKAEINLGTIKMTPETTPTE